ncbi:MAG: TerB family tellurite resistance protein [Parvibaculales bacterium]
MLDRLKKLLINEPATMADNDAQQDDRLHVAAATLLVRAAQIDGKIDATEEATLERIINTHFGLDEAEAASLLANAKLVADEANDLFQFTHQINAHFSEAHKLQLIEMLWQIVLSDGVVDDYEANLLRRVTGLIYITDQQAGAARKRAQATLDEQQKK